METSPEPNCSLISLDNSRDDLKNLQNQNCNIENLAPRLGGEQKTPNYSSAPDPAENTSLISDDDDDEGNLADGSAAEQPKKVVKPATKSPANNELAQNTGNTTENARKSSSNNSLSRKQVSRHTAISRNQKHDKITSNTRRKPKHPANNNTSTATSATEPKRLQKSKKPDFNTSTAIVPHNYSPPSRKPNTKHSSTSTAGAIRASSTANTSDCNNNTSSTSKHRPHIYANSEARARREAQLNKPQRTASKHFQELHKDTKRKGSIAETNSYSEKLTTATASYVKRKSYRPGSAPISFGGQSSREDSTTDVDRVTQRNNKQVPTPTRPVSAATLKMRARRQAENGGPDILQRTGTAGDVQVKRLARLSLQGKVGGVPSPKTKQVSSKIGSLENKDHIPGGGAVKIYDQSPNFRKSASSKIGSLENAGHTPKGGKVKIETKKMDLSKVTSKCGSLENASHVPGGGNVKILDQKIKIKAAPKIGSLENATHSPGGGKVKILNTKLDYSHVGAKSGSLDNASHKPTGGNVRIFNQKPNFKKTAKSKVGSLDNIEHQPGGGDVMVYDEANPEMRKFLSASAIIEEEEKPDQGKGDF